MLLLAAAACTIVACADNPGTSDFVEYLAPDPYIVNVERPRVALLDAETAMISFARAGSDGGEVREHDATHASTPPATHNLVHIHLRRHP